MFGNILVKIPSKPENIYVLFLVGLVCVDTAVFILLCLGTFADVYKESKLALQNLRSFFPKIATRKERKWSARFFMSCGVIKMKFGGNNFVEQLTPLNCLNHGLQIAVQITLLWR